MIKDFDWTDQRVAEAMTMRDAGMSSRQIAESMSQQYGHPITKNAIVGRLNRSRVKCGRPTGRGRWDEDALRKLAQLIKDGLSQRVIGLEFGVSAKAIERRIWIERRKGNPDFPPAYTLPPRKSPRASRVKKAPEAENKAAAAERAAHEPDPGYGRPLVNLTHTAQCRFPTGWDRETKRHLFCGAPTDVGESYCEYHSAVCYQPMSSLNSRIKARSRKQLEVEQ